MGRPAAIELLRFVVRAASEGLGQGRSERFIRDEIRAELLGRFETFAQGLLAVAAEHATLVAELAVEVRRVVEPADAASDDELAIAAGRAAELETRADALVERVRTVSRHDLFTRLLARAGRSSGWARSVGRAGGHGPALARGLGGRSWRTVPAAVAARRD